LRLRIDGVGRMSFVRQKGDGFFYVCRRNGKIGKKSGSFGNSNRNLRDWYLIKYKNNCGFVDVSNICFPMCLVGKRVMLRVVVMDEKQKNGGRE